MKLILVIFLITLATIRADVDCGEERAEECVEILLNQLLLEDEVDDSTECRNLEQAMLCLRGIAADCAEGDEDVENSLREAEALVRKSCEDDDKEEESENEDVYEEEGGEEENSVEAKIRDDVDCGEKRAKCVEIFLSQLFRDDEVDDSTVCRNLEQTVLCWRDLSADCAEGDKDLKNSLRDAEKLFRKSCKDDDKEEESENEDVYEEEGGEEEDREEDAEMEKCVKENDEYLFECLKEGTKEAFTLLLSHGKEIDKNLLQCTVYSTMSSCFVERLTEKCGDEAGKALKEELDDVPADIKAACDAAGPIELHLVEELEREVK